MSDIPATIDSALDEKTLSRLRESARQAAAHAYAPYSNFHVGAATLDEHDQIHSGCNVENASYGLSMCAERNAVFATALAGARSIRAVAIFTPTPALTPPCGACRQVLSEFDPRQEMEVHLFNDQGQHAAYKLSDLLPLSFKL